MKLPRRRFLHLAVGAAAFSTNSQIASAQSYPTRPVRIIVPLPAGADIVARIIGHWLERLGQPVIVENKPGAGTNVGVQAVLNAPPDGNTLLLAGTASAINATLYELLPFNFLRDIAPVAGLVRFPLVMEINRSVPAATVAEFIAYAKANPGKINFASAGIGTAPHLADELFQVMTGVNMVHVPYRGEPPAISDLLAGRVQVMFGNVTASIEYIRSGLLHALAVTTAARSSPLPEVPTVGETVWGTRRAVGSASACQRQRPARSSRNSTRRSMRASPIRRSRRGLPTWAAQCFRFRPATSASSSPRKLRNGARWSGRPISSRSDQTIPSRYFEGSS
jgi:tripartite-type tricarboxylate transporter receptor subunit TctC